jgi:branched-chain amino acid transport system substrate-binding protein
MARSVRALVAVTMLALAAVGCGGDDSGDGSATEGTVDAGVKQGVEDALGGATSTTAADAQAAKPTARPTSMDGWEQLWAGERDAIIKRIKDNGWGKSADGTTLTGPAGFKIDLSKCAGGWSDTEGLSDTSIEVGHTTPLSGTAADYGNIARAMDVIFQYYSDKGTFTDVNGKTRNIDFVFKDDGYDPARTIPLVDELIDSDKVFIVWTLGSPNGLKVYDKLNQRCIPHPLEMSGHPAWGDPVNHPWTTGQQMAYNTEAVLWGAFIEKHLSEFTEPKVKIASLVANNDFGRAYDSFFKAYLAQSPNKDRFDYRSELVEVSAPTVTDPMTTLAADDPDVFITMTGGAQCPQIIQEAAQNGMKENAKYLFMSSVCKAASFVGKDKVGGDGSASNDWWIVGGGAIDFNSPAADSDAFIKWGRELLASNGIDYKASGSFGSGFLFAFPFMQALQIAGELPGGLTRSNFILALRTFDMTNPLLLPGIRYNMNGNSDAYLTEGSDISRYDSAKQEWVQQGDIVELSGKSKPCAFDQAAGVCR